MPHISTGYLGGGPAPSIERLGEGAALILAVGDPVQGVTRAVGQSWLADPAIVYAPTGHTIGSGQVTAANTFSLDFDTDDIVWFIYDNATNWEVRYSDGERVEVGTTATTPSVPDEEDTTPTVIQPDGVTNLQATPGPARVTLTWDAPVSMGSGTFFRYKVDYRVAEGTWLTDQIPNVAGLTATVTGLTNSTAYEFRVRTATTVASSSTIGAATVTATPVANDQPASLADQTVSSTGYSGFKSALAMTAVSPALGSVIAGDVSITVADVDMQGPEMTAVVLKPRSGAATYTIPAPEGDVFDHITDHLELALATANLGTIQFTNTTYTIARAAPIKFEGFTDVAIDLNGATVELTQKALGFRVEDCTRVSIGNGTLTGVGLLATIGTVNIDGSGRPEFIVHEDFVAALEASAATPALITAGSAEVDGDSWRVQVDGYAEMFINRGNATNNYVYSSGTFVPTSAVSAQTFDDGDTVLLLHENNTAHGILLHNEVGLTDISIHDLEMVNIPGMGIVGEVNRGLHIDGVTTSVTTGGLLSLSSDGIHINGNGGDIVVENCVLNQNWDDKINIKGNYWRVLSIDGTTLSVTYVERTTSVRNWGRSGDALVVIDGDYDVIASGFTMTSDAAETANNVHSFTVSAVPGSLAVGMLIGNVTRGGSRVVVRNNTFFETRAQGVLVQSSNVLVRDNRFEGIASPAIKLNLALHLWYEAINVDNVLLDGNEFKRCSLSVAKSNDIIYVYQVDGAGSVVPVIGNVELVDNALLADIDDWSGTTGPQ